MCCFLIISLLAGWRYAGRIFNAGICRGKAISEFRKPEGPPPAPPPSWAREEFFVVVCAALLTFICMLRYSEWNVVPIWFLYSSIFMAVHYADLRSGSGILRYLWWYAVPIWLLDSSIFMMVHCADLVPGFWILRCFFDVCFCPMLRLFPVFLSAGSVSQRKVASGRAAAEEG